MIEGAPQSIRFWPPAVPPRLRSRWVGSRNEPLKFEPPCLWGPCNCFRSHHRITSKGSFDLQSESLMHGPSHHAERGAGRSQRQGGVIDPIRARAKLTVPVRNSHFMHHSKHDTQAASLWTAGRVVGRGQGRRRAARPCCLLYVRSAPASINTRANRTIAIHEEAHRSSRQAL